MKTSYNAIADSVLVSLNQIGNTILSDAIKFSAKSLRAKFLRQDAERNKANALYQQTLIIPLINDADNCIDNALSATGVCVLRSELELPEPIRFKDRAPLSFVGSLDSDLHAEYVPLETMKFSRHNRFGCDDPKYDLVNGYLYLQNNKKIRYIAVRHAFVNPEDAVAFCENADNCLGDSAPFVLPSDMFADIKRVLLEEYQMSRNNEVEINSDEEK